MRQLVVLIIGAILALAVVAPAQDVQERIKGLKDVEVHASWMYNDLPRGFAEAQKTGKPLLVVFRCVPCLPAKAMDVAAAQRDPRLANLLDQFVCVRVVQGNGIDLSLFQADFDVNWHVFFLNADKTIYGRYGTRSHRDAMKDVSIEGFAKTMESALELHKGYPANKSALARKVPAAPRFATPEGYPSLKGRFQATLKEGADLRKSCIHCHMIHEAERQVDRDARQPIPDEVLWRYPMPDWLGLSLDAKEKSTIRGVAPGSSAAKDGFQSKDEIVSLDGQPIISLADVQWVLEHARNSAALKAEVSRGGKKLDLTLSLPAGWRRNGAFTWRASSWSLRKMAAGGMVCEELTPAERTKAGLADDALALRVRYLGANGPHGAALRAGVRRDDILVEFDGLTGRHSESALIAHVLQKKQPGEKLDVTVLRGGQRHKIQFAAQ